MAKKRKRTEEPEEAAEQEAVTVDAADAPKEKKKKKKRKVEEEPETEAPATPEPKKEKKEKKKKAAAEATTTPTAPAAPAADVPKENNTIYMAGLPFTASEDEIWKLFEKFAPTEVRAPVFQDSGRLRGFAHVEFADDATAAEAMDKLNGAQIGGRWMDMKIANAKGANDDKKVDFNKLPKGCKTVFVKGLPYTATEDQIAACFNGDGEVKGVRIANTHGHSKGFAYVEFESRADAIAVLQKRQGYLLGGRKLFLDADTGSGPKAGYHYLPSGYDSKYGAAAGAEAAKAGRQFHKGNEGGGAQTSW